MEENNTPNEASPSEDAPVIATEAAPEVTGVADAAVTRGRRAEKIGIVASDKMQKTVVVRVDRLVKHRTYKRYVRRRTKFMAHNEIEGVSTGDQVRIVETRPLSAHKRWRVVEVLRKASKKWRWGLGAGEYPQSPIPNPQSPMETSYGSNAFDSGCCRQLWS